MTPIVAAWAASSSSSMIPLSGGRCFTCEQSLDAARRPERDRDPVDGVGRERDDPARAQDLDRRLSTGGVVGHDARGHAETRPRGASAARHAVPLLRCGSRVTARRDLPARRPRTSASIIRATPSSAKGGAM